MKAQSLLKLSLTLFLCYAAASSIAHYFSLLPFFLATLLSVNWFHLALNAQSKRAAAPQRELLAAQRKGKLRALHGTYTF